MGNAINAALREPNHAGLASAVTPYNDLRIRDIEVFWRSFYDHAEAFALTRAQLREVLSKATRLLDPHASSKHALQHADGVFDLFVTRYSASPGQQLSSAAKTGDGDLMDALEFLSAIVFIAAEPIEDKVDLLFDSWDMSEDGALDLDEWTISLKSTLLGLSKILAVPGESKTPVFLDDDEIEALAERVFREVAKISSATASLNQVMITCDQFRTYCVENKSARALFDLFDHANATTPTNSGIGDDRNDERDQIGELEASDIDSVQVRQGKQVPDNSRSATVQVDQGDEFLAVKPWKGAIVAPSMVPALDSSAPVASVSLEWIFGYNAQESKNNLRFCTGEPHEIVYPAAAACVVFNVKTRTQRHYLGHGDDVLCLCVHPKSNIVASGEIGKKPQILVWSPKTMDSLCTLKGFHQRAVLQLAFCGESTLVSIGGDDDHSVAVYETKDAWKSASLKAFSKGNKANPSHLAPSPSSLDFVCCGDKYVDFWQFDGKHLAHKKGLLGSKGTSQLFPVAEYTNGGNSVVVGTTDGCLYQFNGRDLSSVTKTNAGAVHALGYHSGTLVVGTKDGQITVWDDKLKPIGGPFSVKDVTCNVSAAYLGVRSCCLSSNKKSILVGTMASEIYEIDTTSGKNLHGEALVTGHYLGETWGLDVHPHKPQCCTIGDDRTLRIWDLETKKQLRSVSLELPGRACVYSSDGKMIAVGLGADGGTATARTKGAKKKPAGGFAVFSENDLVLVKEPCFDAKKWVSDIKFSPDDRVLAVASHDTAVYFYDVLKGFAKRPEFKKHTSYVTHIDFSSDGQHLQSTCGGYELLFNEVKSGRQITNAASLRDERWHTMTSTLGWAVQGIWEDCSDGTDVNSVDRSHDGKLLATADDFGKVKLFRYPCAIEKASYAELRGHASHVTKVKWAPRDKWLLSTGGNDRCLFVWRNESVNSSREAEHSERGTAPPSLVDKISARRDPDPADKFDVDNEDVGDEFMAVKPWLGAIVPPSDAKNMKLPSTAPDARLELERVHGYQAQNAANNARYDAQGKVVYHAAALGIVFDKTSQRQSFFKHHDDDIVALCAHPNGVTFATAQMGKRPKIYTWSSANPSQSISCLEGFHQRMVTAISFSSDGKKLGSVGGDDDHSIAVYSWENGILSASAKGERSNVLAICHHDGMWITCGDKHIRFWREQGKNLTSKKAIFGTTKHKDDKMPGVFECVTPFGKWAVVGASNGDLYAFQGSNEVSRVVRAHTLSAQALHAGSDELVSGGKDGTILVWDASLSNLFKFDLKEIASSLGVVNHGIRSVCPVGRTSRCFLVGTHGSDLIEVDASRQGASSIATSLNVITRGHSSMEVWGIATHPARKEYCSVGDDQLLRVWCLDKKTLLRQHKLDTIARACAIFANGKTEVIAVGLGGRHGSSAAKTAKQPSKSGTVVVVAYTELYKRLFEDKPSTQPISQIKFSPSGSVLAVGAHDNRIYLYKVHDPSTFKKVVKVATFAKHQSYITHFDFSTDERVLQTNCGAYELLFCDTATGKHITSASSTKDVKWHTWTCVLGWPVQGIWPPCSDGTDVNAVDRSVRGDMLVSSDDFGLVKLFRYPCVTKNASAVEHRGHSSHVTNVRWTANDSHVISAGGNDRCLMEWKVVRENDQEGDIAQEVEEDIQADNNSDSDIEEEIEGDEFMAIKPWLGAIVPPTNAPTPNTREPDLHVDLDWVYGYHTELSKQNLVYNCHGEIVYHTAAVGVIYDEKHHLQKHHVCHNDDIMSFAITLKRDIVATGERGKKPVIRVWDAHSGELRSELRGFHSRGVVSLAFALDGSKLLSVGDDDDHSIALWEDTSHGSWTQTKLIANAKGDKGVNRFSCFGKDASTAVTGGAKHVLFWRVEGKTLVSKKGKVGKKGTLQLFPCGAAFGGDFVTGTASGELYVWMGDDLSKVVKAHDSESTVVSVHEMATSDRQATTAHVLLSGGKDGKVLMWNASYQILKTVDLAALNVGCLNKAIASVFLSSDSQRVLIGTCSSDIIEVSTTNGGVLHGGTPLFSGHFSMELWGLAVHPTEHQFTTTGDEGTLRIWDMEARKAVFTTKLSTKARACAYSPDGSSIAVGFGGDNGVRRAKGKASKDGAFAVISAADGKVIFEDRPAKEWISDIKFSPCGGTLAIGSHDNAIYLYAASSGFKKRKPFAKHNSYITHFDFSKDGKFLQSNCGAYELLFCDTTTGDQVRSASSLKDVAWSSWTCTLGWPVQGIWPECADGTDINAVCASSSRTVLATGDDSSKVKLFRYPCTMKGAKFIEARGHASHVTNVRFSHDDKYLISVGGNDRTIFQWKLS